MVVLRLGSGCLDRAVVPGSSADRASDIFVVRLLSLEIVLFYHVRNMNRYNGLVRETRQKCFDQNNCTVGLETGKNYA